MGNRIKELRLEQDMTLLQLAEKLGVSESTVQRYESEHIKNLKYETMVELSRIFGCLPGYVMGWDNSRDMAVTRKSLRYDEVTLLDDYNLLNELGKNKVRTYVADLLDIDKYTSGKKDGENNG